jgi:tetratricopeptide (TPR) repeat protein
MAGGSLLLEVTDFKDPQHWRWVLKDGSGNFIQDYEVSLDSSDPKYRALVDLEGYLDHYSSPDKWVQDETRLMDDVGKWISLNVLGPIADKLGSYIRPITIHVKVPQQASGLVQMALEMAVVKSKPLSQRNFSFVYELEGDRPAGEPEPIGDKLKMLAIFSQPTDEALLALRRERYSLIRQINLIAQTRKMAIELRVLQYGVTRDKVRDILTEGWDLIHFSGHGGRALLLLEKSDGTEDPVTSEELAEMFGLAGGRLKLVMLSSCLSAAATIEETLNWLKLPVHKPAETGSCQDGGSMPAVGWAIADQLDCAALAMRYPVGDEFAINMAEELYDQLLGNGHTLTRALQLAETKALSQGYTAATRPLSLATPMLIGHRASDLSLKPPLAPADFTMPTSSLAGFPPEPERFVGRTEIMNRATDVLGTGSSRRGVIFHGMAGAGKSACALELSYLFYRSPRFQQFVFYKAPEEGRDISSSLRDFALAMEGQLAGFKMSHVLQQPDEFRAFLPKLTSYMGQVNILVVLDNMENLLKSDGGWRIDQWGQVVEAMLGHNGHSRLILTSRRLPKGLDDKKILVAPVHALSLREAALLARELPNLGKLIMGRADRGLDQGRMIVSRTLELVQGHPKLLELADKQAARPDDLQKHLDSAEKAWGKDQTKLKAFFEAGEPAQEAEGYLRVLGTWTMDIASNLPESSMKLFKTLCALEEQDRQSGILGVLWQDQADDISKSVEPLKASGLVDVQTKGDMSIYYIHPGVAEAGLDQKHRNLVDSQMADLWYAKCEKAIEVEDGRMVVVAGLRSAPYLMRQSRWGDASYLLENVMFRDESPSTMAVVLPMVRRIAEATEGTDSELADSGKLAIALMNSNRLDEAEVLMRSLITRCQDKGEFRLASGIAGQLFNILRVTGRYTEALELIDEKKSYIMRAGLGPWSQLGNEVQRLQVLNSMGRYDDVLKAVEDLRKKMENLPEKSDQDETVNPWNVRELILDTGHSAAMRSDRYELALDLNKERLDSKRERRASDLEIAWTIYNDYGPLLRLERYDEARELLVNCREVFQREKDIEMLGKVFSALADLEYMLGHNDQAVKFEKDALFYKYQRGDIDGISISHNNISLYLKKAGSENAVAHRLAAVIVNMLSGSGLLSRRLPNLSGDIAQLGVQALPASFDQLCSIVEEVDGVRFRELFVSLAGPEADGNQVMQKVIEMAKQGQNRK